MHSVIPAQQRSNTLPLCKSLQLSAKAPNYSGAEELAAGF